MHVSHLASKQARFLLTGVTWKDLLLQADMRNCRVAAAIVESPTTRCDSAKSLNNLFAASVVAGERGTSMLGARYNRHGTASLFCRQVRIIAFNSQFSILPSAILITDSPTPKTPLAVPVPCGPPSGIAMLFDLRTPRLIYQ